MICAFFGELVIQRRAIGSPGTFFREMTLDRTGIIQEGGQVLILPWESDQVLNTLALLLRQRGLMAEREGVAVSVQECRCEDLPPLLASILDSPPASADQLAQLAENKRGEKYDDYLPEHLLCSEFASRMLDLEGALAAIRYIVTSSAEEDNYFTKVAAWVDGAGQANPSPGT